MRDPIYGCEVWTGRLDRDGYGRDGSKPAHIARWEEVNGQVPVGLDLHHRCLNRACRRLVHLVAVSKRDNMRLKKHSTRVAYSLCDAGHGSVNAVITRQGGRVCRTCSRSELP